MNKIFANSKIKFQHIRVVAINWTFFFIICHSSSIVSDFETSAVPSALANLCGLWIHGKRNNVRPWERVCVLLGVMRFQAFARLLTNALSNYCAILFVLVMFLLLIRTNPDKNYQGQMKTAVEHETESKMTVATRQKKKNPPVWFAL